MELLHVQIPHSGEGLTIWASLTVAWMVLHYGIATDAMNSPRWVEGGDPAGGVGVWSRLYDSVARRFSWRMTLVRSGVMSAVVVIFCGTTPRDLEIAVMAGLLTLCLIGFRARIEDGYLSAAGEIVLNASAILLIGILLANTDERFWFILVVLPFPEGKITALMFVCAGFLFMGKGGTYIVRALLRAAGAMPKYRSESGPKAHAMISRLRYEPQEDRWVGEALIEKYSPSPDVEPEAAPDPREFRRGRLIGNLERLVILILAMLGSYPAIAFVMTAKGLVRAKEFEDRDYAEYFLVGTLGSSLVALVTGMLLAEIVHGLWR